MKFAVVIYGLPRGNIKTWNSLVSHLLGNIDCDLFIHTWLSPSTLNYHHNFNSHLNDNLNKYINFFKISMASKFKSIRIDCQKIEGQEFIKSPWGIVTHSNQQNSLISINRGIDSVLSWDCKYDYIICTRSDIFLEKPITKEMFLCNTFMHSGRANDGRYECEDLLFGFPIGCSAIMRKIMVNHSRYLYIDNTIYNPFLHEFKLNNIKIKQLFVHHGKGISIYRPLFKRMYLKLIRIIKYF